VIKSVLLLALAVTPALNGCATIFAADRTTINVNAAPGTPIMLDGQPAGVAPAAIVVDNHKSHVISSPTNSCQLVTSVGGGWVVLDVLVGLAPLLVDAITGEWGTLNLNSCNV
jgi:hypothetical protein